MNVQLHNEKKKTRKMIQLVGEKMKNDLEHQDHSSGEWIEEKRKKTHVFSLKISHAFYDLFLVGTVV